MLAYLRQTLVHAVHISLSANAGPVHLNIPFRDPLAPDSESSETVVDAYTLEVASTVVTRPCEVVPLSSAIDMVALERLSCLLYTSPSPRDSRKSRMPSSA